MDNPAHAIFIIAAYGIVTVVVSALLIWLAFDGRRQARALADLEARGVTRRSPRPSGQP